MKLRTSLITMLAMASVTALAAKPVVFPQGQFKGPLPEQNKAVIGAANFEKVRSLPASSVEFQAAQKVAELQIDLGADNSACSGFLVGPDVLLTNHHCVVNEGVKINPEKIEVYMDYLQESDLGPKAANGSAIIKMNEDLDYALIRLTHPIGNKYGWLSLKRETAASAVMVVQHPRARSKEISRQDSKVLGKNTVLIHYHADTEAGSSGSPVFEAGGDQVIALHHVGNTALQYNEGILMSAIYPEIKQWVPERAGAPGQAVSPATPKIDPAIDIIRQF